MIRFLTQNVGKSVNSRCSYSLKFVLNVVGLRIAHIFQFNSKISSLNVLKPPAVFLPKALLLEKHSNVLAAGEITTTRKSTVGREQLIQG